MAPVIPGAPNSFGMSTRAAYGNGGTPTVYRITSRGDSGASTQLRHAIEASGNRVIIFEVGGDITLTSDMVVTNPYLTIAGQTAPAPGIRIRDYGFLINTHDVLFQHFTIRPGADTCNSGVQLYGGSQENIVFDHMSLSWGQDENMATNWTNGQDTNFTMWRCLIAEGLYRAGAGGCSGGGTSNGHAFLVDASSGKVAIIQSLFASCYERNPYILADNSVVLLNNVIYQWHGPWGMFFNNGGVANGSVGGPWYCSAVGNRFIKGPNSTDGGDVVCYMFLYSTNGVGNVAGNQIYRSDNTIANQDGSVVLEANQYSYNPNVGSPPTSAPLPLGYTPLASTATEAYVLANCGARPAERDATDTRVVATVTNRNGNFVADPADVGGYPTLTPTTRTLSTPISPHVDSGNGYTNLEVWLQGYAAGVEGMAAIGRAGGGVVVQDTFTGTAGVDLVSGPHIGEVGATWGLQNSSTGSLVLTNANRLRLASTATATNVFSSGIPLSTQYDVDVDFVVMTLPTDSFYSVWGCMYRNMVSGYLLQYNCISQAWEFVLYQGGSATPLGSFSQVLSSSTTYHVRVLLRDESKSVEIDNVQVIYSTDATLDTAERAGLAAYAITAADTNSTGIHFDNFVVTDVLAATSRVWPRSGGM